MLFILEQEVQEELQYKYGDGLRDMAADRSQQTIFTVYVPDTKAIFVVVITGF